METTGSACVNIGCKYFGGADAALHALVSDGYRGINGNILYLRCQCCGQRKTSRAGTPMYYLKTPLHEVARVITALSEGVDLSAAARIFGYHPATLANWLVRTGQYSARLHERLFCRAIEAGHVQLDELVTKVKLGSRRVWVWTAMTASTRLILAVHLGGRSMADACLLIHQVWQRLVPGCLPVFTSDGLNAYFYALTAHFGTWGKPPHARKPPRFPDPSLLYAQVRKLQPGYRIQFITSLIRLGTREKIRTLRKDISFTGHVQTAYIERSNLTLRELVAPLSRRTWS